jgi:mRNA interferase HigB
MAFTVLNALALDRFAGKHHDARKALADWLDTVSRANWESLADVRTVYTSADGVAVRVGGGETVVATVFNIKGNHYRLVAVVHYATAVCRVVEVLTHAEYSTDRWKQRL